MQETQWLLLFHAVQRLQHMMRSIILDDAPINRSQMFTLVALRFKGIRTLPVKEEPDPYEPMTLSGLARVMDQTTPALSQRITQLEEMGYVRRSSDNHDRRTVWIQLTPEGLSLMEQVKRDFSFRLKQLEELVKPQEMERMTEDFERLSDAVEAVFGSGQADRGVRAN